MIESKKEGMPHLLRLILMLNAKTSYMYYDETSRSQN